MSNKHLKSERFKKIASRRVQKTLDMLDLLENCSNRNNYDYSSEDVDKMIGVIKTKVKELENSFRKSDTKKNNKFKF